MPGPHTRLGRMSTSLTASWPLTVHTEAFSSQKYLAYIGYSHTAPSGYYSLPFRLLLAQILLVDNFINCWICAANEMSRLPLD